MYVSVRDDILVVSGFENLVEGLAYCGLDAVELAVDHEYRVRSLTPAGDATHIDIRTDVGADALAAQCRHHGVHPSAFCLPSNFNAPDIDAELAWVIRVVNVAARLGIPAVRIDAMMHGEDELTLEQRQAIFARGVRHVLDATSSTGVDLGIENHGLQGNDPDFLTGLINSVGSPRLGMTLDTGNFYWSGKPIDRVYSILERMAPLAKHTHVKNIRYPEELRNVERELGYEYEKYVSPIPEGDIDHARVIGFLKAAGYDRDICIEDESFGKFSPDERKVNLRAAAAYLKALL